MDGGIKEDGKWQDKWEKWSVCQPNDTTHRLVDSGERLSQSLQWSSTAYNIGSGTPGR